MYSQLCYYKLLYVYLTSNIIIVSMYIIKIKSNNVK